MCRFCPQDNPSGLPRSALGSDCCTGAACKRARAHERAQRAAGVQVATPTQAETTQCFKVKAVIGVSLCMEQMSAAERRVGRERADEEIRCQVRGKFGSDADEDTDDMLPDTRWFTSPHVRGQTSSPQHVRGRRPLAARASPAARTPRCASCSTWGTCAALSRLNPEVIAKEDAGQNSR